MRATRCGVCGELRFGEWRCLASPECVKRRACERCLRSEAVRLDEANAPQEAAKIRECLASIAKQRGRFQALSMSSYRRSKLIEKRGTGELGAICRKCGQCLPRDAFSPDRRKLNGLQSRCKECRNLSEYAPKKPRSERVEPAEPFLLLPCDCGGCQTDRELGIAPEHDHYRDPRRILV